jgi:hypothetical protein
MNVPRKRKLVFQRPMRRGAREDFAADQFWELVALMRLAISLRKTRKEVENI